MKRATYTTLLLFSLLVLISTSNLLMAQSTLTPLQLSLPRSLPTTSPTSNQLPQPDDYDKCFSRATMSDQYEWIDKEVEVRKASVKVIEVPAEYETIQEKVLVKEETVQYVIVPPRYKMITEKVIVKEAAKVLTEKYENVTETVLTQSAYGEWAEIIDPNCFSSNPKDCTIMQWREVPAAYDTLKRKMLTQVGDYAAEEIPSEYIMVQKRVMIEPAKVVERIIPAEYKEVRKRIVVSPAKKEEILIPATYETVKEKRLVKKGGEIVWVEVLCPLKVKEGVLRQIQVALLNEGIYKGAITGKFNAKMKRALKRFQESNGLPVGNLNTETLLTLGLISEKK